MFKSKFELEALILLATVTIVPVARQGNAANCPVGGITIDVCVKNPTAFAQTLRISGSLQAMQSTCSGMTQASSYSQDVNVDAINGSTKCFTVSNLMSGMWVHNVVLLPSPPYMHQYRKMPVLYAGPTEPRTRLDWTYFPSTLWINAAGDGPADATRCPRNGLSSPPACRLRDAIAKANLESGSAAPVLVLFAVAPGQMTESSALTLTGGHITIDGIETDGRPWIVGDPGVATDPFTCVVDLANVTRFTFDSDNNTIQGLEIRNTLPTGILQQAKDLIMVNSDRKNNLVYAVKIDGGNTRSCPGNNCSGTLDLFSVLGGVSFTEPGVTIRNVLGHSAIDKGVKTRSPGWAVVKDSWFHHNYRGNIQATQGGKVRAVRNAVQKGGRRATDDLIVDDAANGLVANDVASRLETDANVVLLNRSNGISVRLSSAELSSADDYTCGNRFAGVGVSDTPMAVSGRGIGAVYNGDAGLKVSTGSAAPVPNFGNSSGSPNPGRNAFAQNDISAGCPVRNDNSSVPVEAHRNQWVNNVANKCGSGGVNFSVLENYITGDVGVDAALPTIPSNAILAGQSIRIRGTGFDAIRGNPAPSGGCIKGEATPSQSCCLSKPQEANVCGSGLHDPLADKGNCVEICDSAGTWSKPMVTSGTPTTIVAQIPGTVLMCTGQGGIVHVSKKDTVNSINRQDQEVYCTNVAPKDGPQS